MQMKKLAALAIVGATMLATAAVTAAPTKAAEAKPAAKDAKAPAKPKEGEAFGNWRLNCNTPKDAKQEICELDYVFVTKPQPDGKGGESKPQMVLTVGIIKPANSPNPVMVMRASLGAFLQPPPMIKLPGHKDVTAPFLTCNPQGCTTLPLALEKEFLDAARATEAAVAKDPKAPGATISIGARQTGTDKQVQHGYLPMNFELNGFAKGLAALEAKSAPPAPAKDAGKPKKKK